MGQYFSSECQEVVPNLYIGHIGCATDAGVLGRRRITRIVDVSGRPYEVPPGVEALRLNVPDIPTFDIRQIFGETNDFISRSIAEGQGVLVHCHWGVSRSASVVLAYLMAFHHLTLEQSLALVRNKRSVVQPNLGFMYFLTLYQRELELYRQSHKRFDRGAMTPHGSRI